MAVKWYENKKVPMKWAGMSGKKMTVRDNMSTVISSQSKPMMWSLPQMLRTKEMKGIAWEMYKSSKSEWL